MDVASGVQLQQIVDCSEELIDRVLDAATNVQRELGPGLLESVYEQALMLELNAMGIPARNQVEIPGLLSRPMSWDGFPCRYYRG